MTPSAPNPGIVAALSTLKDVVGIAGSFAFTSEGRLIGREMHAMFDDATLTEAGERLVRLHDTFLAVGDDLDIAVIRFQDHKLYLKALPGGMLCILADGVVNIAALRMAANLVGRRITPELQREDALPPAGVPALELPEPATAAEPSTSSRPPVIAPGTRRFRGHSV